MKDFIQKFTKKEILKEAVKHNTGYYLISLSQKQFLKSDPVSIGLYLGKRTNKFIPSINLLNILTKHTINKAAVDKKQEWLFVCGRDLFKSKLISIKGESPYKLVINQNNEVLGYGILQGKLLKNLFDVGDFLRRER